MQRASRRGAIVLQRANRRQRENSGVVHGEPENARLLKKVTETDGLVRVELRRECFAAFGGDDVGEVVWRRRDVGQARRELDELVGASRRRFQCRHGVVDERESHEETSDRVVRGRNCHLGGGEESLRSVGGRK